MKEPSPARPPAGPRVAMVVEQMWQPVPGGSGTYIVELLRALGRLAGTGSPTAPGSVRVAGLAARHPGARPEGADLPAGLALRHSRLPRPALYEAWNWLERPLAESVLPGADVVHATTWAVPGTRLPLAVTVHDLAFVRSPEHFTRRGAAYFTRALERTRRRAGAVIVPSRATADDCLGAGISSDRLHVIPHGVTTVPVSPEQVASWRAGAGLERDYVLWTGTREPRKNLPTLLRAFQVLARSRKDLDLVLVGPAGWGDDSLERELAAELPGRVHVLGRLSLTDLACAYTGARVFTFPSHWEGFGLPVLEAMAYGAPVVTSRGTCMEEVCADAALLASPDSPAELAAQLDAAAGPAHDDLVRAGLARAARFTWQASARAHAEVYVRLAAGAP